MTAIMSCTWRRCCRHIRCRTFPTTVVFELDDIAADQAAQPDNPLELPAGPAFPSSTMVTHSPAASRTRPPQQSSSAGAWERSGGFIDLFGSNAAAPRRPTSTAASSLQPALQPADTIPPPPIAVAASVSGLQDSGPHDSPQTPPPRSVILPPPPFSPPPESSLNQSNISMVNPCCCHHQAVNHQLIHHPAVSVSAAPSTAAAHVCRPRSSNGHGHGKGGQRRDHIEEWQKNARDLTLQRECGI